jgi:RNA polymerase sigma factor (sigma-70 family)
MPLTRPPAQPRRKPAAVVSIHSGRTRQLQRRNELIEQHLDLVRAIAANVKRSLPPSFELDDLIAVGCIALVESADRYRPSEHGGAPFSAYARFRIRGAILDSVRRRHWTENTRIALEDAPEPAAAPVIDTVIDQGRLRKRLAHELAYLDPDQRAVIQAYYGGEQTSIRQVAENAGETVWTHRLSRDHCAPRRSKIPKIRPRNAGAEGVSRKGAAPRRLPGQMPKAAPTKPTDAALAAEIDELGSLEKEFAPLRAKLARIEFLRASIRARFDSAPAYEAKEAEGARYMVQIGRRGNVSTVNVAQLVKAIGAKAFHAIAGVSLKTLEANVAPNIVADVVSVAATGPRTIKTFEKGMGA